MRNAALTIAGSIHVIRGHRVMLDQQLAKLYGVSTKAFNQAVKRQSQRFPADFRFQLTDDEAAPLRSQIVTSKAGRGGRRYLPWVFTQEGVAMLSGVLNSPRAITVNIEIMRAFVPMRQAIAANADLAKRLAEVEARMTLHGTTTGKALAEHDRHIRIIFETLRRLMVEDEHSPAQPIGFRFS